MSVLPRSGSGIKFRLHQLLANLDKPLQTIGVSEKPDWSDIKVNLVVSTGRTGTHFFSHFFSNNFRETHAIHEPKWDDFYMNMAYFRGNLSHGQALRMLDFNRKDIYRKLKKEGMSNYVESNTFLSFMLPVIRDYYPNCRIIHVIRNTKDVVRSYYSRTTAGKWVGEVSFMAQNDPRDRLRATDFENDPFRDRWAKMDRFERIVWMWARHNELIKEQIKDDPNAMTIKFEDLFKKHRIDKWEELIRFMGLEPYRNPGLKILDYLHKSRSNQVKNFKMGKYESWTPRQKRILREIAGKKMEEFGYEV